VIFSLYHAAPTSISTPTHRYRVERADDGWLGLAPGRAPFGPARMEEVFGFLEWRATEDLLASPDAVFLHAAGVRLGGRSVLLVGPSGSGKSTLAAHLFVRGHAIWGDDLVCFASHDRLFSAAPRSLKLDANTLESLSLIALLCYEGSQGTLLASNVAYVSPAAFRRRWRAPDGAADAVVLLDSSLHHGTAQLQRIGEGEAALTATRMLMGGGAAGNEQEHANLMARVLEAMSDMRAYRASGSPASALADALERELAA
jgi:hypothetical protein